MTTKKVPPWAVVNQEFARKVFGSAANAWADTSREKDGARIQVVASWKTEITQPHEIRSRAVSSHPATPIEPDISGGAFGPRSGAAVGCHPTCSAEPCDAGLLCTWDVGAKNWTPPVWCAHGGDGPGVMGVMGAMLSITGIFDRCTFRQQAPEELAFVWPLARSVGVCRQPWDAAFKLLGVWLRGWIAARNPGEPRSGFHRVPGKLPRIRWY